MTAEPDNSPDRHTTPDRRHRRMALGLLGVVAGMTGLAYASVPLYAVFCRVTGYGGTTRVATAAPAEVSGRRVTVRFNADVNPSLSWDFRPVDRAVSLRLGEQGMTSFTARNRQDKASVGTATFNVTPDKAGKYFNKIACFCFDEQTLAAGAAVEMPVVFYVDPDLANDRDMDDVTTITLSYTFFRAKDEAAVLARTNAEPAPTGPGVEPTPLRLVN